MSPKVTLFTTTLPCKSLKSWNVASGISVAILFSYMLLLIDPEISYLEDSQRLLREIGYDVLVAEEERELIRLCFDFRDHINVIAFDSERLSLNRRLQEGLEYALKYAGISHVALVEWNLSNCINSPTGLPQELTSHSEQGGHS